MAIRLQTVNKSDAQVILWVRVSTDRQEVDSMTKDLIDMAKLDGFTESQMIIIASVGASARKADKKYLEDINTLINLCENNTNIVAVYCWEVSRLARKLKYYNQVRETVKDNGIQLVVLNPKFRFFDKDKNYKTDFGVDLALNLLALFAEQEMELKEVRYKRGKQRNREQGKFNGGANGTLFGYTVDKDGYIVIDEEESKVVKMIFEKYATGNYSTITLANEMSDLGYKSRKSSRFTQARIYYILNDTSYLGQKTITFKVKGGVAQHILKYPRIISDALFNQCKEIRKRNLTGGISKQTKHLTLATKILKCKECGSSYTLCSHAYRCVKTINRFNKYKDDYCTVKASINADVMDSMLWEVVKFYFLCDKLSGGSSEQTRINEEKAELEQRLQVKADELQQTHDKKDRLNDTYIDGRISKEKYTQKWEYLEAEEIEIENKIDGLKTKLAHPKFLNPIEVNYHAELSALDKAEKRQLCLTYLKKAYIQPVKGQKKTDVEIYCQDGGKFIYRYDYYKRRGQPYQLISAEVGTMLRNYSGILHDYAIDSEIAGAGLSQEALSDIISVLRATIETNSGNAQVDNFTKQYADIQAERLKYNLQALQDGMTQEEYLKMIEKEDTIADVSLEAQEEL